MADDTTKNDSMAINEVQLILAEKRTSIEIKKIDPAQAIELINELDAYQEALYPPESNHFESLCQLRNPGVKMFGGMIDGELAVIGAVKLMDGYGEIKRVFVSSQHRGKGLAKEIMNRLESEIKGRGLEKARLETGIHQKEAIGLYEKIGYVKRKPFGPYKDDPLSIFMEKRLFKK